MLTLFSMVLSVASLVLLLVNIIAGGSGDVDGLLLALVASSALWLLVDDIAHGHRARTVLSQLPHSRDVRNPTRVTIRGENHDIDRNNPYSR